MVKCYPPFSECYILPFISYKSPAGTIVKYEVKRDERLSNLMIEPAISIGIFDTKEEAEKACSDKNKEDDHSYRNLKSFYNGDEVFGGFSYKELVNYDVRFCE